MRKLNCPQCNIPNFYIMNDAGERRLVLRYGRSEYLS